VVALAAIVATVLLHHQHTTFVIELAKLACELIVAIVR
jgi:hypothetical protein